MALYQRKSPSYKCSMLVHKKITSRQSLKNIRILFIQLNALHALSDSDGDSPQQEARMNKKYSIDRVCFPLSRGWAAGRQQAKANPQRRAEGGYFVFFVVPGVGYRKGVSRRPVFTT